MKGFAIGLVVACATAVALLAGPSSAGAVICPPPPCDPSPYVVCALDSGSSAAVIVPCGCPIALDAVGVPLPYGCADLSVTERVDRATASVGDVLTYTVDVRNAGPETALDTTVVDALPAGLALVSAKGPSGSCGGTQQPVCVLGSLGVGEAAIATVTARAIQPGQVANPVTASTTVGDLDPSNDQATAITDVKAASPAPKPPKPARRYAKRSKHRRR